MLERKLLPGELLQEAIEVEQDYKECATRHDGLIEWAQMVVKKLSLTK